MAFDKQYQSATAIAKTEEDNRREAEKVIEQQLKEKIRAQASQK